MKFKKGFLTRILIAVLITVVLAYLLAAVPLPYVYRAPGRMIPAKSIVKVENGKTHKGTIFITTVIVERANVILYLYHLIQPLSELTPAYITGRHAQNTPDPYQVQLTESIYRAKVYALLMNGYDVPVKYGGAQVTAHLPNSKSQYVLQPGDIIVKIDDVEVNHQNDIHRYTNRMMDNKDVFEVTFIRNGKRQREKVKAVRDHKNRATLGTYFHARLKRVELPVKISINPEGFSGSSAGLPIFLGISNQLSDTDLTKGHNVAASGTLGDNGEIRPVYGVEYKVKGADANGCKYFLCATGNYEKAKKAAGKIKIIPVKNVKTALKALKNIR